ncbi:HNH endonuclease [Bradyrhizobium sp. CAR08]
MTEVIKRRHAKAAGLLYYFTGKPCPHGHLATRNVASRNCMACVEAASIMYSRVHRDKCSAAKIRRYHQNPASTKLSVKRWQSKNADKVRGYKRKWQADNPEAGRVRTRNRRARLRSAPGAHTLSDIRDIMRLQRGRCAYCPARLGSSDPVDHIHALVRGGSNDRRNLQILCKPCNSRKGAKDPIDFARQLGFLI